MSTSRIRHEVGRPLRALVFAAGLATLLMSTEGCGSSSPPSRPSAAERYVTLRIGKELQRAHPVIRGAAGTHPDIFVYCRLAAAGAGAGTCQGTVASTSSHEAVANQRWRVNTAASGAVLSANPMEPRLVPAGPAAERLAALRLARRARRNRKGAAARELRRPATLALKGAKGPFLDPTYVCVANGRGKVLFQGVIRAPRVVRLKARQLRVNLGNSNATLHVNGKIFRIPASPYGISISRTRVTYLPLGQRPCRRR